VIFWKVEIEIITTPLFRMSRESSRTGESDNIGSVFLNTVGLGWEGGREGLDGSQGKYIIYEYPCSAHCAG
jgi:hypothetical protein